VQCGRTAAGRSADSAAVIADTGSVPSIPEIAQTAPLEARDTTFTVDRVVAIVGNRPILASQVEEEIFSRESQGAKLPTSAEGMEAKVKRRSE
jgi:hypothetical protein